MAAVALGSEGAVQAKSVRPVDFSQAYWTPPLPPKVAFKLESNQIEIDLGLMSLVSLTDHDSIGAPTALRELPNPIQIPYAVEAGAYPLKERYSIWVFATASESSGAFDYGRPGRVYQQSLGSSLVGTFGGAS